MEKAETLSFPTVIGSGGRGQSLHGERLVGAKGLRSWFQRSLRCEIQLRTFLQDRTHNQFLHIFLHTGKLCHDVTSCDLLEFWLWRNVIRWAPIVIFHTFAKCCVLRYYYYVGTGYVFFSSTASHDLRIFTIVSIRSPDKEIVVRIHTTSREGEARTSCPDQGTRLPRR